MVYFLVIGRACIAASPMEQDFATDLEIILGRSTS
jgi:hypothetical protein